MSVFLKEAEELLLSISSLKLSLEERQSLSIELASLILKASFDFFPKEKRKQHLQMIKSVQILNSQAFIFNLIDHSFRCKDGKRNCAYLNSLIERYKIAPTLPLKTRLKLLLFKLFSKYAPSFWSKRFKKSVQKTLSYLVVTRDVKEKEKTLKKLGPLPINLVYLKEKVLSKEDEENNLNHYLTWLLDDKIDCVSVKASAISAELDLFNQEQATESIFKNLKEIYKAASFEKEQPKTVFLEMEDYSCLYPIWHAFKKALEQFPHLKAGISLQAYLPESFSLQQEITSWAKARIKQGGAPIELCLVKGAYLSLEQVNASKKGWPQAPFHHKSQTDANFKRMLSFGLEKENAAAVHVTVGSHNVFDLAYSLILAKENQTENFLSFQFIKGRADHLNTVFQKLSQNNLRIYTPIVDEKDFVYSMPYIIRRMEEVTGMENFLRHTLKIYPSTAIFENFQEAFLQSFEEIEKLPSVARREQDRKQMPEEGTIYVPFDNEPDTDFSLPSNKQWKNQILEKWQDYSPGVVPLSIGQEMIYSGDEKTKSNPSNPYLPLYKYILATKEECTKAIDIAKAHEQKWAAVPVEKKKEILKKAAQLLKAKRADFIGALMLDTAKVLNEADTEVSQAIDMLDYYLLRLNKILKMQDLEIKPKGAVGIFSSRSFPLSVPTGGIAAALITGNCVIFRPAFDAVFCGWFLASILWEAGIPKEALQFINADNEKYLLQDLRLSALVLTGKNATVEKFLNLNPLLDLNSASEGKNSFIISAFADKKRAIQNLLASAFTYSGQKYASVSVAILEKEIYQDNAFLNELKNAAANLKVGPIWKEETQIGPLIHRPDEQLLKALTFLDEGEKWLLQPKQDPLNPNLWSPGIKLNVKTESFFFKSFLPGPVLGLIEAENFQQALAIANNTKYGLSATLETLNEEEFFLWQRTVEAGNYYCNRDSLGTIIRRQPFGGHKKSAYGLELKAGGPNYLQAFIEPVQTDLPREKMAVSEGVNHLASLLETIDLSAEELGIWYASTANYSYWWFRMQVLRDPIKIVGEDNFFGYIPRRHLTLRIYPNDKPLDILRIAAAALTCEVDLEISLDNALFKKPDWLKLSSYFKTINEKENDFFARIAKHKVKRIRLAKRSSEELKKIAAAHFCYVDDCPVLANGRLELLHYLKEISLSRDYHRFGNLGARAAELRKPLL